MNLRKYKLIAICFFLLLANSGCGLSDYTIYLPNNYTITGTSSDHVKILSPNRPVISAKIEEVAWDDRFVIVKRFKLRYYDSKGNEVDEFSSTRLDGKEKIKEVIDKKIPDYFLLDTLKAKVYGPFKTEIELSKKQKEFGVEKLKLKKLEEYDGLKDKLFNTPKNVPPKVCKE